MLRPEEMTRAVVVGSIDSLDVTIECLYELGILHLIDFTEQDEEFKLGQPLRRASGTSQKLLKLRAMIRSLEIESHKPAARVDVREIQAKIEQALVTLDMNTSAKAESKQKIQALIREKESETKALEPFRMFIIPVEDYEGYDSLSVFTGVCKTDPEPALRSRLHDYELQMNARKTDFAVALFARSEERLEAGRILAEHGFQEIKLPKLKGYPAELISKHRVVIDDLEKDLKRIEADLESIRKHFADFIVASEEHLAIEVLKAETPLRIAASANSFVIDGWIPTARAGELQMALDSLCCGLAFVETLPAEKHDEPPVKLKNPRPVKPFEFFIDLVSTPKYNEIDPTTILFITFPLFLAFMVGDLGFGASLVALGIFIRAKFGGSSDAKKLGAIIIAAGIMASVFGLFVFAEAFGVPFHPPEESPDEHSWEAVANIPIHPMIEKMHDVTEMLALSLLAGWLHLMLGYILGIVNTYRHNIKHAIAKVAWILVLFGLFVEVMLIAGDATITSETINSTILSPIPTASTEIAGIQASYAALVFIVVGVIILPVTEGALALTEVAGVLTNLVSYTRLAALAVGKGGMALAFNTMFFPLIFDSGNIFLIIVGAVLLFITQAFFVFFIGSLSAGIQAIRLNYVEFFLKFFEGGGTDFSPLKYERKHSVVTK
jgi:V/A-type H+-transporting ATPase subunit I